MNVTNDDFNKIEKALQLLPEGDDLKKLPKAKQKIICEANKTMLKLIEKKEKLNEKTKNYIAEKRKTNKDYARTPYIKKRDRENND